MFEHRLLTRVELECETTPNGRYYVAPDGTKLDSVTTRLGRLPKDQGLIEWRDRVGDTKADGIMRQAAFRGSNLHDSLERYLRNNPDYMKGLSALTRQRFRGMKPVLDEHVGIVYGIEFPLYSLELATAGRMDLAANWDGTPSVIDFKTSNYPKDREKITNYFLQAAAYSYCLKGPPWGLNTQQLVILVMVEGCPQPQVFVEKTEDWVPKMLRAFTDPDGYIRSLSCQSELGVNLEN